MRGQANRQTVRAVHAVWLAGSKPETLRTLANLAIVPPDRRVCESRSDALSCLTQAMTFSLDINFVTRAAKKRWLHTCPRNMAFALAVRRPR